jgi:2,3-diaminopropionate biosynthesis protein SbnA
MIRDRAYDIIIDDVFLRLTDLLRDSEVFLKIEGLNFAGSIKLKTAVSLIEDAEQKGYLGFDSRIIESSSGNLGIALSAVCAAKNYSFTCITDPKASPQSIALMKAMGAQVIVVDERDLNGGYLGTRIALLKNMIAVDPSLVWLNQYANEANPRVHWQRTAKSILNEINTIDYLFIGAGTTGTLMGCASYFRQFSPDTRIIAVDTLGSVTFGYPAGRRHIPGLGTSRTPEICNMRDLDEVMLVDEADAVRTCRRLAKRRGLLVGGSTGSVISAIMMKRDEIQQGSRIVAISPDLGERYLQTIYNDDWVATQFGSELIKEDQSMNVPLSLGGLN